MKRLTRYCRACWRSDVHRPIKVPRAVELCSLILSLGAAWWLWPYQCSCCGKLRIRGGE